MNWEQQNAPDIDKQIQQAFNAMRDNSKILGRLILMAGVVFIGMGSFYTVQPEEEAVVTRFGKYARTTSPGLQFKAPLGIEKVTKIKTKQLQQESFGFLIDRNSSPIVESRGLTGQGGFFQSAALPVESSRNVRDESLMLTGDLNVADVQWVVQYQVSDPRAFLFNVQDPRKNIRDIAMATMRRVVGDRTVNDVLTTGRNEIAGQTRDLMQKVLDKYEMGVAVVAINLHNVNPPGPVQPSFNEVNAAKQEQEQAINRAESHYNRIIPEARGQAEKNILAAQGLAKEITNRALGDSSKLTKVIAEFEKAPEVTKKRMYLETIEELMGRFENMTIVDPSLKGLLPVFGEQQTQKIDMVAASIDPQAMAQRDPRRPAN